MSMAMPGPARIFLLLAVLALLAACRGADDRLLEPRAAYELIERNRGARDFLVLDVRTPGEFRRGYIEGAVLMNYYDPDFRERFAVLDRSLTILTYCHVGGRSSDVLALADELGFERVFDLRGGIVAWKSEGMPLAGGGTVP
ncbi:MAG TPA: rhodanese-like domain-containing protein [Desulfomicrobium sp.]|nr:rhodanese-like domain-containing protein [Desulfomicrobium sp.]